LRWAPKSNGTVPATKCGFSNRVERAHDDVARQVGRLAAPHAGRGAAPGVDDAGAAASTPVVPVMLASVPSSNWLAKSGVADAALGVSGQLGDGRMQSSTPAVPVDLSRVCP